MTNSIAELDATDAIFVIGANTTEAHPVIGYRIKQAAKKGTPLIVADPRRIELVDYAQIWLRHRPGTDVALIHGLLYCIVEEGLLDETFIAERTEGFEELKKNLSRYHPDMVSKITGVPKEQLWAAARLYGGAPTATICYAMGITQHITGTDNVLSLANLTMATGNVGRLNTGLNPLRGQNNVQGACDMGGLPNVYPGYQKVDDPAVHEKFARAWGTVPAPEKGLTMTEMMEAIHRDELKALYIMGENPVLSDAHASHVREALKKLDFLVTQDIFLNETGELAHVVLPSTSFAEKEGTFTNTERRIQRVRKVIPEREGARSDWEIIQDLARRLGQQWDYDTAEEIMEEIAAMTPSYGGISHKRLEGGSLQWPCPNKEHRGTPYLHKEGFARGKGLFTSIEYIPPAELPDDDYPFLLTTGRKLHHFHTGTMSRRSKGLAWIHPRERVEIHPLDAQTLSLTDGDSIRVTSRRGEVEAQIQVTDTVPPGVIFMSFHFAESAVNVLTNPAHDPVAKIPEFKVCGVRIQKV